MGEIIMKLQIQSVIYGNQVDALVKAMKALQQAVKSLSQTRGRSAGEAYLW